MIANESSLHCTLAPNEFSISNEACTHLFNYTATMEGPADNIMTELYELTQTGSGVQGKFLTKSQVIQGLEKILSVIDKSKASGYRVLKITNFLELAVLPAKDDEMFYLHIIKRLDREK